MEEKEEKIQLTFWGTNLDNGNRVMVAKHEDSFYFRFKNKELGSTTDLKLSKEATSALFHILFERYFSI